MMPSTTPSTSSTPSPSFLNKDPTTSSSSSTLPSVSSHDIETTTGGVIPLNGAECTSLAISPTGSFVVAGCTDGTIRLLFLMNVNNGSGTTTNHASSSSSIVLCQIGSKGSVHTLLQMTVALTPDGLWALGGATRGSAQLVALHVGHLAAATAAGGTTLLRDATRIRNSIAILQRTDAKLRGFGACTQIGSQQEQQQYLLLTGKSIKTMHIWRFTPHSTTDQQTWQHLYDVPTNGNTIQWLSFGFRKDEIDGAQRLVALSQSQGQKLRVWDLSDLSRSGSSSTSSPHITTRPPFADIPNTEATLAVADGFCFCGSGYNQEALRIVSLYEESEYNATELAVQHHAMSNHNNSNNNTTSRRQQRGDLKTIVSVAACDADCAVLELSDGTLVQYRHGPCGPAELIPLETTTTTTLSELPDGWTSRKVAVGRVGKEGIAVAAIACYHAGTGAGTIQLRVLDQGRDTGCWGWLGTPTMPRPARSVTENKEPNVGLVSTAPKSIAAITTTTTKMMEPKPRPVSTTSRLPVVKTSLVTPRVHISKRGMLSSIISASSQPSAVMARRLASSTPFGSGGTRVSTHTAPCIARVSTTPDADVPSAAQPTKFLRQLDGSRVPTFVPPPATDPESSVAFSPIRRKHPAGSLLLDVASTLCQLSVPNKPPHKVSLSPFKSPTRASRVKTPDRALQKQIREECTMQQAVLVQAIQEIPTTNRWSRTTTKHTVEGSSSSSIQAWQEAGKHANLAAQHQAAQQRAAKSVLRAAWSVLESIKFAPSMSALNDARTLLQHSVQAYQQSVDEMLQLQELEWTTLLSCHQALDRPGPPRQFAFPQVFGQAATSIPLM